MTRRTFLIEDNPADVKLIKRALALSQLDYALTVFSDGEQALAGIMAAPPDLIILDLNVPRLSGEELLVMIKAYEPTAHIPIIILTTSDHDADVNYAYSHGANAYVVKPLNYKDFICAIQSLGAFWFNHARLKK